MLFALVATTSYSGNLRAFLTTPDRTGAISTLPDLLGSGYPWMVTEYGDTLEHQLASSDDGDIRTFWREREPVAFEAFPYDKVECGALGHFPE